MRPFEQQINETQEWFDSPDSAGSFGLYTARQVVEPARHNRPRLHDSA